MTEQGVAAGARALGADERTAGMIGAGADLAIGVGGSTWAGVTRRGIEATLEGVPAVGRQATLDVLRTQAQTGPRNVLDDVVLLVANAQRRNVPVIFAG